MSISTKFSKKRAFVRTKLLLLLFSFLKTNENIFTKILKKKKELTKLINRSDLHRFTGFARF